MNQKMKIFIFDYSLFLFIFLFFHLFLVQFDGLLTIRPSNCICRIPPWEIVFVHLAYANEN